MNDEAQRMLAECSTPTMTWWVIQFEDETYFGHATQEGFMLKLYRSKSQALREVSRLMDQVDVYYRAVEITLPEPNRD